MRVVHLSTTDVGGGAARGSYALHRAMVDLGVDSHLVVERKSTDDPRVHGDDRPGATYLHAARHRLDRLPLRAYPERSGAIFSPNRIPSGVVGRVRDLEPDIVHLHWVGNSFVTPEDVPRFEVPVVWTLRDMWAFTGGCHYSRGCLRYTDACGRCPHLGSSKEDDLSRSVWDRKSAAWRGVRLSPVAISRWMADRAQESSLLGELDVRTIANAIDTDFWFPSDEPRGDAGDSVRVLFVALAIDDVYKGFDYFVEACGLLKDMGLSADVETVVVGEARASDTPEIGVETTYLGRIDSDIELRSVYRSAQVTVVPSTEEAFGKTAAESMACGTPVVCFDDTGVADVVEHGVNGYRARYRDASDLARGIAHVLQQSHHEAMRSSARASAVEFFSVQTAAQRYVELYRELIRA